MAYPPASVHPGSPGTLFVHWQAEAVRLREARQGPLEDRIACQQAMRAPAHLPTRILTRADVLATRSGLQTQLLHWRTAARWAFVALVSAAFLTGIGAAAGTLAHGQQGAINLASALLGLLGLHALTFLIWLASTLPGIPAASAASQLWLWSARRLTHGEDTALAAHAFLGLLARARAWKALIGTLSHALWTAAFLGALPTLIVLFSTRRYTFHWETTLLSLDSFTRLTQTLGSLPRLLGFPIPATADIAASLGTRSASAVTQADWSLWLLGCVLAWGLLPRLLALAGCLVQLRRRLRRIAVDPALPGWLELRERLMPSQDYLGVDRAAPARQASVAPTDSPSRPAGQAAILAYELGPRHPWPPETLPEGVHDLGRCDSREDRQRVRAQLLTPPRQLLLVCDAALTPDRGAAQWLDELQALPTQLEVLLTGDSSTARRDAWHALLRARRIPQASSLDDWLAQAKRPHDG